MPESRLVIIESYNVKFPNTGPNSDKNHAFLNFTLTEFAETTDILVTLNTPWRRSQYDDIHGNPRYLTVSHPSWVRIAPTLALAVKAKTAIWINRQRLMGTHEIVCTPKIPDTDHVNARLTAIDSTACHKCKTTDIDIPVQEIYENHSRGRAMKAMLYAWSATACHHSSSVRDPEADRSHHYEYTNTMDSGMSVSDDLVILAGNETIPRGTTR